MKFTHLNVHSKASMLFATADMEAVAKRIKELGQDAVALTDYGNVYETIPFYKAAKEQGIKPILGATLFFCEDAKELRDQKSRNFNHIVLLAENDIGWQNITRLISSANDPDHFFYNPRIDFNLLEKYKEGIIVLTGNTRDGIIAAHIPNAPFRAEALVRRFLRIFDANHFFLEVQNTGDSTQKVVNDKLRAIAQQYGLKTVATGNVHYVHPADAEAHKALLSIENNKYNSLTETDFTAEEYYIKGRDELAKLDFTEDELTLAYEIGQRCNVTIDLKKHRLPKYDAIPVNLTAMSHLRSLCFEAIRVQRLAPIDRITEYSNRLDRELGDIEAMGFADYFLIVYDVINWCRKNNILLGYGRGSVGGSLVAYVLGITNIDPIEYGLIWERFLNRGRGGLPDIDTDVPKSRRQDVLEYIRTRFGKDNVAQIVNYNSLKAKAVLKEVFRIYNMDFAEANKITACVPGKNDDHTDPTLEEALAMSPELRAYEKKYPAWFKIAHDLEGCYKTTGIHAAAVVISDTPFSESPYPLARSKDGGILFGWDMNTVDTLNLLKLDILGLSTLDDIDLTRKLVNQRRNLNITRGSMPLDDPATYAMLGQGFTIGVFQIEKQLGKIWSKALEPNNVDELSDLVSLIRPGPMESDMHTMYKDIKHGNAQPEYIHPMLEPIMGKTHASLLYQEQVIEICKQLAGMSLVDADKVRKAMGKKKPEEMKKWREVFVKGCMASGIDEPTSIEIWGYIEKFAGYGFNKSHGIGYALLSYETAYLKANYTLEFTCAKLIHAKDQPDAFERIGALLYDAKLFGIELTPPRLGCQDFAITSDTTIAFGITALKGIGEAAAKKVMQLASNMTDFDEFLHVASSSLSTSVVEALIKSGTLDMIGGYRVRMLARSRLMNFLTDKEADSVYEICKVEYWAGDKWTKAVRLLSDDTKADELKNKYGIKRLPNVARRQKLREALQKHDSCDLFDSKIQNIAWEKEYLGVSLSGSEADIYNARNKCVDLIKSGQPDMEFEIAVCIDSIRSILTKKGDPMAFVTGRDKTYTLDGIVVFPNTFSRCEHLLETGNVVKISGKINDRGSYIADSIDRLA